MNGLFADIPLEMSFTCPVCGKNFQIPTTHDRHEIECPHCKAPLTLSDQALDLFARSQDFLDSVRKK